VALNKSDIEATDLADDRVAAYRSVGIPVLRCSARTGTGLDAVINWAAAGLCAVVGQSGVGKSSLLNALDPSLRLRTGAISRKYNRGTHVTNFARLLRIRGTGLVDTPGIREIDLYPLTPEQVAEGFVEIADAAAACEYGACTHVHEPGCAVRRQVDNGTIHPDRYESYLRILSDLELSRRIAMG
jgi:ribosome biogenesis GTPase